MVAAKPTRFITYNASAEVDGQVYLLYRCPQNCSAQMSLLYFANANGSVTVDVEWYRVRYGEEFFIVGSKNMATGEFVQFSNGFIVLEAGDEIRVKATGTTPDVDFMCTVEEEFKPVG